MSTTILESRIKDLCEKIRISGKTGPAEYFESLLSRIRQPLNDADKEEALQQIITSGKISDMANFSVDEDKLLDMAHDEAKKLKK